MKNNFLLSILIMVMLINSCAVKRQKAIAIDVLITLPENMYHEAVQLNKLILKDHPNNFTLDEDHIPHITLLQCYIQENDLPKVTQLLKDLYGTIENESLNANSLQFNKEKAESFASIGIEKSTALMSLHEKSIALLKPYIITKGSQKSYVQNEDSSPIDQFTIDYVPKFVTNYSYENYNPHISLGVAKTSLLDSLAHHQFRDLKFPPKSLAIYQLGNYGTARKLLWKSK